MTLAAQKLDVAIGGVPILHGIDAVFERGRVTVVLGPNGAGKSTLLSTLAGLRSPDGGSVTIDGTPLAALPPRDRARRIGYLPQGAELHWNLEVHELVALGRLPRQGRFGSLSMDDEAAIDIALRSTDTHRFKGRLAGSLSGGERARVLLARVLAGEPDWILADEPLASLDPAHQIEVLALLQAASRTGVGVVIALHDLMLAGWVADACLILKQGAVLAHGPAVLLQDRGLLEGLYGLAMAELPRDDGPPLLIPSPGPR